MQITNKILSYFQFLVIKFIDPIYSLRHPSKLEILIINLFSFIIFFSQPNDRWNLHIFVKKWIKILSNSTQKNKNNKNILMFTCYRGQFTHDIILSILLAKRGHNIILSYLPKLRSPIKEPLFDSADAPQYLNYVMNILEKRSYGKIKCIDLSFYNRSKKFSNNHYSDQAYSDTVMMLQKENIELNKKPDLEAYNFCMERLKKADNYFHNLFNQNLNNIDLCLIANGASFENSQFLKNAKLFNIKYNTYEKFAFKNARIISHNGPFHEFEDLFFLIKLTLKFLSKHKLKKIKRQSLKLMLERKKSLGNFWGLKYQKVLNDFESYEKKIFELSKKEKFILICPNVPFDAGYESINSTFPSMKTWLIETIEYILKNSNHKIIVRAHPAEERENFGNEKCENILNKFKNEKKLNIIPGKSKINTYSLIEKCMFNIVYSSSTGVESVMLGKTVLTGASCYHGKLGITRSFKERSSYFLYLNKIIKNRTTPSENKITKAQIIYYLLHFVIQLPYPYDKPSSIVKNPPNIFFFKTNFLKYFKTLDILTMDVNEYKNYCKNNLNYVLNTWNEKQ